MWGVVGSKSLHWEIVFKKLSSIPPQFVFYKINNYVCGKQMCTKIIPNIQILSLTFVVSPSLKTSKSIFTK